MPVPNARTPSVSFTLAPSVVDPSSDDAGCKDDVPADHALDPPPVEPPPDLPPAEPPPDAPEGSLIYAIIHNPTLPRSPTSPFEFPLIPHMSSLASEPPGLSVLIMTTISDFPLVMDSIMCVIGSPRVFSLRDDSQSYVQVRKTSSSLIIGGANICLTGDINLLVHVFKIPPLPISVAVHGDVPTLDDSCSHQGYLPLTLSDGSTHWQLCFS